MSEDRGTFTPNFTACTIQHQHTTDAFSLTILKATSPSLSSSCLKRIQHTSHRPHNIPLSQHITPGPQHSLSQHITPAPQHSHTSPTTHHSHNTLTPAPQHSLSQYITPAPQHITPLTLTTLSHQPHSTHLYFFSPFFLCTSLSRSGLQ